LEAIQSKHSAIKEDTVVIAVPVCRVDIVKPLRKLHEGSVFSFSRIKHEAYGSMK
jgi:predicted phosphoribosyltransferase